jgi:hypothetical protein
VPHSDQVRALTIRDRLRNAKLLCVEELVLHDPCEEAFMTRVRSWCIVGIATVVLASCTGGGEDEPLRPDSVLTWNVFLGASVTDALMAGSMAELADRVEAAWSMFQANDFSMRAEAIADRIAAEDPALVGLQEVVTVYIQQTGDRLTGGDVPANELVIDFEQVLLAALAARGLDYRVAARSENADVELPSASGQDIRLVDHDLILVRGDITVGETDANAFEATLPVPVPDGESIDLERGFVWAVVTLRGTPTLFVNTHLEVSAFEPVQLAQAAELLAWLSTRSEPVILVGDFNSRADPAESTETYDLFETAGYDDAWTLRTDPAAPGFTCCQTDMRSATSTLDRRIDFIWLLGMLPAVTPDVHLVGEQATDRTASGLWPSNHAGVVATFAE